LIFKVVYRAEIDLTSACSHFERDISEFPFYSSRLHRLTLAVATKGKRYTLTEKVEYVNHAKCRGSVVAKEIGVSRQLVHHWCKLIKAGERRTRRASVQFQSLQSSSTGSKD
jgi:hypothetical protein